MTIESTNALPNTSRRKVLLAGAEAVASASDRHRRLTRGAVCGADAALDRLAHRHCRDTATPISPALYRVTLQLDITDNHIELTTEVEVVAEVLRPGAMAALLDFQRRANC
jgi:hypothetical protein